MNEHWVNGDTWVTPEADAAWEAQCTELRRGPQLDSPEALLAWAARWQQRHPVPPTQVNPHAL